MLWRNDPDRYGAATIALHWLMVALLAAVYLSMELHEAYPKGSDTREALKHLHYVLGVSVLLTAAVRLVLRVLAGPAPAIVPAPTAWERAAAAAMHTTLYLLLLGMPLVGWALLSADGGRIEFLGMQLPPLLGKSEAAEEWLEEVHEAGATMGYWLVGLHAAAAVFHHYVRHDQTLRRMWRGAAAGPAAAR